jgi:hypothetical protein
LLSTAADPTLKPELAPTTAPRYPAPVKVLTRVLSATTGLALVLGLALVQPPVANAVSSSTKRNCRRADQTGDTTMTHRKMCLRLMRLRLV